MKCCFSCAQLLPLSKFRQDKTHKNGYRASCAECERIRSRERYKINPYKAMLSAIKQRCNNPNAKDYRWYGSRGIKCELVYWQDIIQDIGFRKEGETLDRIDNNNHYTKGNLRWITMEGQSKNTRSFKRTTHFIKQVLSYKAKGETNMGIARIMGCGATTIKRVLSYA